MKSGVIEGFFGKTWSASARLSQAEFLRDHHYQFYIYAPKADAFLRRRWREPMPAETMEELAELSQQCRQNGIEFGIGLTPFEIYLNYDERAQAALCSKVAQLNELGAERLCILFDDMRGDIEDLGDLQARVVGDVCEWSDAQSFAICPTYYSYDARLAHEFGPPPKSYLSDLGRIIDPQIDFFWTGEKVISEGYSAAHLTEVAENIGRKPFIWDNYIANDSKFRTSRLFLDTTSGAWHLPADLVTGLAVNPMNQPYLSRLALLGYQRKQTFAEICNELCGPGVAERLLADADLFQNAGLTKFDDDTRARLLQAYEQEQSNPYAQEVTAWLRGEYVFDPACLTS
jgi:hyaluronoglucosaminidase